MLFYKSLGDIEVKVLDSIKTRVDLKADSIKLDDQLHVDGRTTKDDNNNLNYVSGKFISFKIRNCTTFSYSHFKLSFKFCG